MALTRKTDPKPKKCRMCPAIFIPQRSMQFACSPRCGQAWAEKLKAQKQARAAKEDRKSLKVALEKAKTRGTHLKELQGAFNAWVRARDAGMPCISCLRYSTGMQAGHYRSVGSCPELRYEPSNCFIQCVQCNMHLHGNLINYRANLIEIIGTEKVEWLEGSHEPKKYTIAEIVALKAEYRAKVREMKKVAVNQLEESYV